MDNIEELIENLDYENRKGLEVSHNLADAWVLSLQHQRDQIERTIMQATQVYEKLEEGEQKDKLRQAIVLGISQEGTLNVTLTKLNKYFRSHISVDIFINGKQLC